MRSFLFTTTVALIAAAIPLQSFADTLFVSPSAGNYTSGKTFVVNVYVSTPQAINAVSGHLRFPQDKLQVISVSKSESILTLWVEEPTFSNVQGTIDFEGVVPNPGFTGSSGKLLTVNFRVVAQGTATVKFDSGSVLANDGSGTNILKSSRSATFNLGGSVAETPPVSEPAAEPVAASQTPRAPVVTSDQFIDTKSWYAHKSGTFEWKLDTGITAAKLLFGKSSVAEPTVLYEPAISSKELKDLEDGIWYLHVRLANENGWGATTHHPFRVDNTKPYSFTIKEADNQERTDPRRRFNFSALDGMSGIDSYKVVIDDLDPITWRDDGSGIYASDPLSPGEHTLVARAYDEAGNYAVASIDFTIDAIASPDIDTYTKEVAPDRPLIVTGTALPNATVHIYLSKRGLEDVVFSAKSDDDGAFTAMYGGSELQKGTYKLYAVAEDERGARSEPSAQKSVSVRGDKLESWGIWVASSLVILIPIVALLLLLGFLVVWGLHKISSYRKRLRKELHEVESTIDRTFDLLKEDITDSLHMLEHAKTKRRLTEEESAIVSRFRENLAAAEKVIRKEIRDVEKDIG